MSPVVLALAVVCISRGTAKHAMATAIKSAASVRLTRVVGRLRSKVTTAPAQNAAIAYPK